MSILTSIFGIPLAAAFLVAVIPRNYRFVIRTVALLATSISAIQAVRMFALFDAASPDFQFVRRIPWVPSLGIEFHVGVDGVNAGLILMGALVGFAATCLSKEIRNREKQFYFLLLLMTGGILGAFASLDLFFLYSFHELALIPTFIMIGVWGHGEQKNRATFQMTLYLSLGALIALVGLIALYLQMPPGARTFNVVEMTRYFDVARLSSPAQQWIFPLLLFGFGVLVSLWPFHTWAPLGYGSAPTPTAMLHAGVLKKFGLYALIRVALPMTPDGAKPWLHLLAFLSLGNLLYCGWVAMRQRNLNLLLGNSSVAHMGFAFLGIASMNLLGVTGTVLVMVAHGFLAALAFGLSGWLRQQLGTLEMSEMGGLMRKLPFVGGMMTMAMFAGCGLPGFANFPGELMVMFGAWKGLTSLVVVAAWAALIVGAVYALRAVRAIWHGDMPERWAGEPLRDARDGAERSVFDLWRRLPFLVLIFCLLAFGIGPQMLTSKIEPAVARILKCEPQPPRKAVRQMAPRVVSPRKAPRNR